MPSKKKAVPAVKKPEDSIAAYKGFDKDWKCRGFQFEVGKTYTHEGNVSLCNSGFHAVIFPLDAWTYYAPTTSQYAQVKLSGVIGETNKDSKRVGSKISIDAKMGLMDFIKAHVKIVVEKADKNIGTGDSGHAAATGYSGCAFAGFGGTAKSSATGSFAIAWYDDKAKRARIIVGNPGEHGIKADTAYTVNDGKLVEVDA